MQALRNLSAAFSKAALRYNDDLATHVITPETVPNQPQQFPTTSPRVPLTPMLMPPPRVQPTVHCPRVPTSLPTSPPSAQPKTLFPAVAGFEEHRYEPGSPYKSTKEFRLRTQPGTQPIRKISHIPSPLPVPLLSLSLTPSPSSVKPFTCTILPYEPTSTPLKMLRQSQQIADLGNLEAKANPNTGPSCNTCTMAHLAILAVKPRYAPSYKR